MNVPTPVVSAATSRYELLDTIASGGMARVYLGRMQKGASNKADPAPVAVKILHPHLVDDPDAVALFLDEARVATRIRHPNVVSVRDVDMVGHDLVIVMEYVEGIALSGLLRGLRDRSMKMPISAVVRVVAEALRGLHAAHELVADDGEPMKIVHRDVSPHNIIVGADGLTRVTDFGVATSVGRLAQTRTDGVVRGKLQYLAPEQIHRKDPDRRVDVWAAGVVLWECLTGRRLFEGGTEAETLSQILRDPIDPPSTRRHEVPLALDDICLRALERDPARRFATAEDFANALEHESDTATGAPADVSTLVETVDGPALQKRRDVFEKGPTSPVLLPARFAVAMPAAAQAPASARRSNMFALVAVAAVSLVVGGLAMKLSGAREEPTATIPSGVSASSPVVAAGATTAEANASNVDSGIVMELPASSTAARVPSRGAHPSEKRRGAARPAASPGAGAPSGRPFMPSDL